MSARGGAGELLLGEWACLGILCAAPAHGFAVAARLKPTGDVGRVWALSRALTYRSLEQLTRRGYVQAVAEEPGIAGGNRTILAPTAAGRTQLLQWLTAPVIHLRDLRSELLLKLVVCDVCGVPPTALLQAQQEHIAQLTPAIDQQLEAQPADVVLRWRSEAAHAAGRFVAHLLAQPASPPAAPSATA